MRQGRKGSRKKRASRFLLWAGGCVTLGTVSEPGRTHPSIVLPMERGWGCLQSPPGWGGPPRVHEDKPLASGLCLYLG